MQVAQIALAGLENAQAMLERASSRLAATAEPEQPVDTVDLSADIVALLEARNRFTLNVRVARISDEMTGSVLDLLA